MKGVLAGLAALLATAAPHSLAQTLAEVVDSSEGCDADYLQARAEIDAAHYRLEGSKASRLPVVNLQVRASRDDSRAPDTSATPPVLESQRTSIAGATLNGSQTLFNRQDDIAVDEARTLEDSARAQLRQVEQDLVVRVSQGYFNALTAAETVRAAQANEKGIAEQLESVRHNFAAGNATITDIRDAEAREGLAQSQQIAAESDLFVATEALDQVACRVGVVPHPLPPRTSLPPMPPSQMPDWLALAEDSSPALEQARLALAAAALETGRARAGHLPTLQVNATYGRSRQHYVSSLPDSSSAVNGGASGVSLTLNVPLFSGLAIQSRVNEASALEVKAQAALDGARKRLLTGVRTTFASVQTQAAQIRALEAAEAASQLALDATSESFKAGVKLNLDVLNARSQLYLSRRDLAGARYQYLLATLKLRQAAGTLNVDDVRSIDALLSH